MAMINKGTSLDRHELTAIINFMALLEQK